MTNPALAAVPDAVSADRTPSIQGERAHRQTQRQVADKAYVAEYVRAASDEVLTCRQGYKHRYPVLPRTRMRFDGLTPTGYLRRTTAPCMDCGCARQVQLFESFIDENGEPYVEEVRKYPEYIRNKYGEEYLTTGHGKMRTKDIRSVIATEALDDDEALEWAAAAFRHRQEVTKGKRKRKR